MDQQANPNMSDGLDLYNALESLGVEIWEAGAWVSMRCLSQFEILMNTPKVFANFSPGFEHRENPGIRPSNSH